MFPPLHDCFFSSLSFLSAFYIISPIKNEKKQNKTNTLDSCPAFACFSVSLHSKTSQRNGLYLLFPLPWPPFHSTSFPLSFHLCFAQFSGIASVLLSLCLPAVFLVDDHLPSRNFPLFILRCHTLLVFSSLLEDLFSASYVASLL